MTHDSQTTDAEVGQTIGFGDFQISLQKLNPAVILIKSARSEMALTVTPTGLFRRYIDPAWRKKMKAKVPHAG